MDAAAMLTAINNAEGRYRVVETARRMLSPRSPISAPMRLASICQLGSKAN